MPDEIHISSLVVHSRPERRHAIAAQLAGMDGIELHGGVETGKLIVVLETATEQAVLERLNAIQSLDGVLAATLVFHHVEPAQGRG